MAGCQAGGEKFLIKDQRSPEQVGLRTEWVQGFGRDGILASQPSNLGKFYADHGELRFEALRLTNTSDASIEVYPSEAIPVGSPMLSLRTQYWCLFPRSGKGGDLLSGKEIPMNEHIEEYFSEFDLRGVEFAFDSGGVEAVEWDSSVGSPRAITIRAGESAVVRFHLTLANGFSLLEGAFPASGPWMKGGGYLPLDAPRFAGNGEATLDIRTIFGAMYEIKSVLSFLVRNSKTDELHPLYIPGVPSTGWRFGENAAAVGVGGVLPNPAYRAPGLPVQI